MITQTIQLIILFTVKLQLRLISSLSENYEKVKQGFDQSNQLQFALNTVSNRWEVLIFTMKNNLLCKYEIIAGDFYSTIVNLDSYFGPLFDKRHFVGLNTTTRNTVSVDINLQMHHDVLRFDKMLIHAMYHNFSSINSAMDLCNINLPVISKSQYHLANKAEKQRMHWVKVNQWLDYRGADYSETEEETQELEETNQSSDPSDETTTRSTSIAESNSTRGNSQSEQVSNDSQSQETGEKEEDIESEETTNNAQDETVLEEFPFACTCDELEIDVSGTDENELYTKLTVNITFSEESEFLIVWAVGDNDDEDDETIFSHKVPCTNEELCAIDKVNSIYQMEWLDPDETNYTIRFHNRKHAYLFEDAMFLAMQCNQDVL